MNFTIYDRREYFVQLAADISRASTGDRVVVAAMSFDSREPLIQDLLAELSAAAGRGAEVTFLIDAFTFLIGDHKLPGPLLYRGSISDTMKQPYAGHYAALRTLESAGVKAVITNTPAYRLLPPHKGRSHIKAAVINDKCYIGGCNLTSATQLDIMASFEDQSGADWLYDNLLLMARASSSRIAYQGTDRQLQLTEYSRLILDAGRPGQSAILEAAYQLIDEAEDHILLTCQFFPGGTTAKRLLAAHDRGVRVEVYFSHPAVHQLEAPIHMLYTQRQKLRLPKPFFEHMLPKGSPKLHAKVLLSEKAAMLGSHNYVPQGVTLGTAELALCSASSAFIHDLRQKTTKLLGS